MTKRISIANLQVAEELYSFVNEQILPGTTIAVDTFWDGFAKIITDLSPKNNALLLKRMSLQQQSPLTIKRTKPKILILLTIKSFSPRLATSQHLCLTSLFQLKMLMLNSPLWLDRSLLCP